jgi:hypothetical protein
MGQVKENPTPPQSKNEVRLKKVKGKIGLNLGLGMKDVTVLLETCRIDFVM